MNVQRELLVQSYRLRVKAERDLTSANRSLRSQSNHFLLYFKGEQGLTQTLMLPLSQIKDGVYENLFELLNVGKVNSLDRCQISFTCLVSIISCPSHI